MGFQKEIEERGNNSVYGQINDVNCFVSSIVQSQNLVNAAHYDVDDSTASIATWTKSISGGATDWYFIMTNTSRDVCRGIAIILHHGVTIRWDARQIFHCSMVVDEGNNNYVDGTFFGTKK